MLACFVSLSIVAQKQESFPAQQCKKYCLIYIQPWAMQCQWNQGLFTHTHTPLVCSLFSCLWPTSSISSSAETILPYQCKSGLIPCNTDCVWLHSLRLKIKSSSSLAGQLYLSTLLDLRLCLGWKWQGIGWGPDLLLSLEDLVEQGWRWVSAGSGQAGPIGCGCRLD